MDQQHTDVPDQANETIARQAEEIKALKRQLEREQFAQELRQILIGAQAVSTVLAPFTHEHLLEMVVQTAAEVISAHSGSLFLLDEEANDLIFKVAIGPAAQSVKKFRVPLGHGVVGMVVLTGQPMAIANAQQDERLAYDIASAVNYIPESILCVPLFYDDRVIGALELLNKMGAASFSPEDMDMLGSFANIAAFAIAQSQAYQRQSAVLHTLLSAFREESAGRRQELYRRAVDFSNWVDSEDIVSMKVRELAQLVHELIISGDQEFEICRNVMQSFVTSTRNRRGTFALGALH
ncbi:MAG TPA: GAF domain-containing protein [Ktedonobacteraceae bacterium]|nr:GAF domain-containing protein [Ktedonobacteraceae bacterium]